MSFTDKMRKETVNVNPSQVMVKKSNESKVHNIYEKRKKPGSRRWTEEETKKFYESLGSVHTNFTMMSRVFNHERSRRELKLKFKVEERKNRDLVDKALSVTHNVDHTTNENCGSDLSVDMNPIVEEIEPVSVENKSTVGCVPVKVPYFKPRAKHVRRIRKFYFESSSDEEGVQVKNKKSRSRASCKRPVVLTLSSENLSSTPPEVTPLEIKKGDYQCEKPNSLPKSEAGALNLNWISARSLNIPRPTILSNGEKGKRQTFDAHVALNTKDTDVQLDNSKDRHQTEFNRSSVLTLSSEHLSSNPPKVNPLEIKKGDQCEKPNSLPKSDSISARSLNIPRPTILRNGEKGKRQTFDAHVALNTKDTDVQLDNSKDRHQTKFNRSSVLTLSSEHLSSNPPKVNPLEIKKGDQCEKPNSLPKSDSISARSLNIPHPSILRNGGKGKRQTFDAHVALTTKDTDVQLENSKDTHQTKFNRHEKLNVTSRCMSNFGEHLPLDISHGSWWETSLRRKKSALSSKQVNSTLSRNKKPADVSCSKIPQPNNGSALDVVHLLLGDLKCFGTGNTNSEIHNEKMETSVSAI